MVSWYIAGWGMEKRSIQPFPRAFELRAHRVSNKIAKFCLWRQELILALSRRGYTAGKDGIKHIILHLIPMGF